MSVKLIERSAVTTGMLTELRTLGFPVGDNSSPTNAANEPVPYGWLGEPDAAGTNFIPWITLSPMPGGPSQPGQGPQDLQSLGGAPFWLLNYSIYVAGVNRNQSELLADRARTLLCNLGVDTPFTVEGPTSRWNISGVTCPALGSNQRVGEAIPYYYTQTDSYQVWATEGD